MNKYSYEQTFESYGTTSQIVKTRLVQDKGLSAILINFEILNSTGEQTPTGIRNGKCIVSVNYKIPKSSENIR